ncbi:MULTISPECIES: MarR family winged helix-turn-helix transcriptional regulator [Desulfosediminicola]|uniref:MarR family winged helix-turn-helix transcriptional regulator n=1 Tax=Desulfosediminicola TaxID=2886823 RepID=UPI0010AB5402|nr:MarR family transcriptional regulator [Desulfosediminicola ganghwensis]
MTVPGENQTELDYLSHQLLELYDKINSWEHSVVKGSGLSPSQMHAIEVIGHRQDMRMKELAERLGITTGTLTVTVDKLEKKGLVARKPHQHDRRSWLISLTESGHRIFRQHDRFHLDFTKDISADLNTQDIETLSKLLSRVLARM